MMMISVFFVWSMRWGVVWHFASSWIVSRSEWHATNLSSFKCFFSFFLSLFFVFVVVVSGSKMLCGSNPWRQTCVCYLENWVRTPEHSWRVCDTWAPFDVQGTYVCSVHDVLFLHLISFPSLSILFFLPPIVKIMCLLVVDIIWFLLLRGTFGETSLSRKYAHGGRKRLSILTLNRRGRGESTSHSSLFCTCTTILCALSSSLTNIYFQRE